MHKYMFSALCFADWFLIVYIKVVSFLDKIRTTDLISVKLPNFEVLVSTIIAFLW